MCRRFRCRGTFFGFPLFLWLGLVIVGSLLVSCGQKGDLYWPVVEGESTSPPAPRSAPVLPPAEELDEKGP